MTATPVRASCSRPQVPLTAAATALAGVFPLIAGARAPLTVRLYCPVDDAVDPAPGEVDPLHGRYRPACMPMARAASPQGSDDDREREPARSQPSHPLGELFW